MSEPSTNPQPRRFITVVGLSRELAAAPVESVSMTATYEVANPQSVPANPLEGAPEVPSWQCDIPLEDFGGAGWRGRVPLDAVRDENLFGRGVCHWRLASVTLRVRIHGLTFAASLTGREVEAHATVEMWFRRAALTDAALTDAGSRAGLASLGAPPEGAVACTLSAHE